MPCRHIDLGDGASAIVCTRETTKKCYVCGRRAPKLCDYPVTTHKSGTCDRPCCLAHCESQGPDKDYCMAHAIHEAKQRELTKP